MCFVGSLVIAPTGIAQEPRTQTPSVIVDPVTLTEVSERVQTGLNIGAAVNHQNVANGIQKAADVWGLHVDLFVQADSGKAAALLLELARNGAAALIGLGVDSTHRANLQKELEGLGRQWGSEIPVVFVDDVDPSGLPDELGPSDRAFASGFAALRRVRNAITTLIPKYDEILPIIFPISPIPDNFFQATKFPYPDPVIRSPRTVSSRSASAHAHTSCHAGALLGNMIHHTSKLQPDTFLLGFEGGNLSIKAQTGAVARDKLSAIMVSYVIAVRGKGSERRDLLSGNDGLATSAFKPSIHSPEQIEEALKEWMGARVITGYRFSGDDELILDGFKGKTRKFRASFFLVSTARKLEKPKLEIGIDRHGRWMFEALSTQQFLQIFSEVPMTPLESDSATDFLGHIALASEAEQKSIRRSSVHLVGRPVIAFRVEPRGGLLNEAGGSVGTVVGFPLGSILQEVQLTEAVTFKPYVMTIEGGFLVVTPEKALQRAQLEQPIARFDFDERGPLGSDQTLIVSLSNGKQVTFRRTILNPDALNQALQDIRIQGWTSGWEFVGARGQGLAANVVLYNFLGKNRKFMSSLNTWPSDDHPARPVIQWYVDGMQRLNFSLVTPEGWRQEFVEVPISVMPIPRDVSLYAGLNKLN